MELRVLQYFLAVAREQSISAAAERLHLSQPTLSTQLKAMEDELGKQLLIRGTKGSRKVTLTEEGMILRKRAEEIMELVRKAEHEISLTSGDIAGDIFIGTGETEGIRFFAKIAKKLRSEYPQIRFHISSGNSMFVLEQLDKGLIDFGLIFASVDNTKYDSIHLPVKDHWGILMRRDSPLAKLEQIRPEDLWDKPLIISQQELKGGELSTWLKRDLERMNIAATYNLIFNASILVEEGVGYAIGLDRIINVTGDSSLCFRPLVPRLEMGMKAIWKKYQVHSKASEKFLQELRNAVKINQDDEPNYFEK